MDYQTDSSKQEYLETVFGWEDPQSKLRLTITQDDDVKRVRVQKMDANGHLYPGPEVDINSIPRIIEALAKIFADHGNVD